tara:strand:- start:984 stop:1289 length:306 start_codon:yes stop_codon:yes gene_type:complete
MNEKQETFTPGPWAIEDCTPGESTGLRFAINSKDNVIARTTDGWKEAQANARLIAAAPELLEQCKLFEKLLTVMIMEGDSGADLERDNLRAILDRVEGESA